MDLEDFLRSTPDELQHYGVKGMKWGRRKGAGHTIDVRSTPYTKANNKRQYVTGPGIGGLALMAYSGYLTNRNVNKQLSEMYTDPTTKIFTATGNVAADMMIKDGLKYAKSNKIVPEKYGKK